MNEFLNKLDQIDPQTFAVFMSYSLAVICAIYSFIWQANFMKDHGNDL